MLQTVLMITIPTMVALTLAYLTVRHSKSQQETEHGGPPRSSRSVSSTTNHRGCELRNRKRAEAELDKECVVCFETGDLVELYPCRHRDVCEVCVRRLISAGQRICPLCRKRIQGYMSYVD